MQKIIINTTGNERWDAVATALHGEQGTAINSSIRDGVEYYDANFPGYGAVFYSIPASVCTLS